MPINRWIDKEDVVKTHNGILLGHFKKKMKFCAAAATWMDLESITPSEISQTEKDRHCMISLMCGI